MIECFPLHNDTTVTINLLNDGIHNVRCGVTAGNNRTHVDGDVFSTENNHVAVWQHVEVVLRGEVAASLRHKLLCGK